MTREEIIKQLENTIELIKQDGKDWLDDRDIPILEECIKSLTALDKIRAKIEWYKSTIDNAISEDELKIEGMKDAYTDCLKIIDKYKVESEK